jgi:hypothetical protein
VFCSVLVSRGRAGPVAQSPAGAELAPAATAALSARSPSQTSKDQHLLERHHLLLNVNYARGRLPSPRRRKHRGVFSEPPMADAEVQSFCSNIEETCLMVALRGRGDFAARIAEEMWNKYDKECSVVTF